jgi:hypothetical protein
LSARSSTAAPILAVLAIVLVLLGAYVAGYFWLGTTRHPIVLDNESGTAALSVLWDKGKWYSPILSLPLACNRLLASNQARKLVARLQRIHW